MSWCTLNTKNFFEGLFTKDWITKTIGNVRELLFLCPFNIPFGTLIVIVVVCNWTVFKSLLEIDLLGLREPSAGRLSPSVVEIEEHVVQVVVLVTNRLNLVEVRGYITHLIQILRSYLTNVKIDHMAIIGINLSQFILCQALSIKPVMNMDVLVGKDNRWTSVVVTRRLNVKDLKVL